jgi:hypothetical protein
VCVKCVNREYQRDWYSRQTPAQRRAWVAKRDPEKIRANKRKYYLVNGPPPPAPRKHQNANNAVYRAKKLGLLVPEPCLFCDNPNVVAHHHDYSKHLDVTWLCRHHHGRVHHTF